MEEARPLSLVLRVAEALSRDGGRGIARLDPEDMARLGVQAGDVILLSGKRDTVAKVMPTYPQDRGQAAIQIDGIIRENAQVRLGEKVTVEGIPCPAAASVLLAPQGPGREMGEEAQTAYLARLLEGLPVVSGDRVRVNLFGSRKQDFVVLDTVPAGVVRLQPGTAVKVKGGRPAGEARGPLITYEDIGGLHKEIRKIREMIEFPLKYPEVFERLGIEAPKGVLLYGPPGCGKTLIARAVASETSANFYAINGPEIMHKFYGESEAHLRQIFEEASQHAPAIIFLDEIDAVAPKRAEVTGEVEKRVVAQLLALMDGLKTRGKVVVIGATNIPDKLDPALRRPGRFDREINIAIPDKNGRLEILQIHTRGMPLADDVDLERMAGITHGFVGADLEALCREAAMHCLREVMPEIDLSLAYIPLETLEKLVVKMDDFAAALREVEPSAIREVFTEVPEVRWEDVGGLAEVKQQLQESIEWPLKYGELFNQLQVRPPKGILLTGPPGCGKTLLAKAVASASEANFISVKGAALMSKYVGESEKAVQEVFRKARQAAPCIVFFDEIDALVPARGSGAGDAHVSERVIGQFLSEMDGIEELKGVIVLAATNRPDIIDPALRRAGRFDLQIELPRPDPAARLEILQIHTRGKPLAADVELSGLAAATAGCSGADLEALVHRAALAAIREFINAQPPGELIIHPRHLEQALAAVQGPTEVTARD